MKPSIKAWKRDVHSRRCEENLPDPVLPSDRPIHVRADRLQPSTPHPAKLLRVQTDYFVAGAVWEKIGGCWSCTQAAPIIKWMKGRQPKDVGISLLKMGAKFQWTPLCHGQPHEVTA